MLGIDKKDLDFLKKLQHELLTQDHICQASPRFWVVRGKVKDYGIDEEYDYDGTELISDCDTIADNIDDAIKYIKDNLYQELKEKKICIRKNGYYEFSKNRGNEVETIFDMKDIVSYMNNLGYDLRCVNYRLVEKNFENTMFLTNKECKAHIKSNYYHYPSDAHSYAMTAWRAPEVSRVWDMLEKINWEEVEKLLINK